MNRASRARLGTLISKEWFEFVNNRMLLGTGVSMPLIMTAMAAGALLSSTGMERDTSDQASLEEIAMVLGDRAELFDNAADAMALYLGEMGLMLLLFAPLMTPTLLAAATIVREKQTRSLESILTTPVRTWELVLAKQIFCLAVGVLPMFFGAILFYATAAAVTTPLVFGLLASPAWVTIVFIGSPLIAIFSIAVATAVSTRAADVQSAQQMAGMLSFPAIGLMVVQGSGVAALSLGGAVLMVGILALLAVIAVAFSISLFERETVLTRWKA